MLFLGVVAAVHAVLLARFQAIIKIMFIETQ